MLLVPGCIEPETASTLVNQQPDPSSCVNPVLDVTFREDDSRVRDRTAARNFALLRKIALNLVAKDRSTQTSLRGKRKRAAWDDGYMLQILAHQAHASTLGSPRSRSTWRRPRVGPAPAPVRWPRR